MIELSPDIRTRFQKVSDAVFTNPFTDSRENVDRTIVDSNKPWPALVDDVLVAIRKDLTSLGAFEPGTFALSAYSKPDQNLISTTVLFDLFHAYGPQFDDLVIQQIAKPASNLKVVFAAEVIEQLCHTGFAEKDALVVFAFMFQIRRAYFFLSTTLVGDSISMQDMRREVWNALFTYDLRRYIDGLWSQMENYSTLLLGETGTGKGVVANALGQSGWIPFDRNQNRFEWAFTQSFIASNLSEYTSSLIESALFGHKRGAFTGAVNDGIGLFERCRSHGTIFLDEIGELDASVQIKLLRVLQERTFTPVGSQEAKRFDGRVVAATNVALDSLRSGRFRDDFYHRISTVIIDVPSLRTRLIQNPKELEQLLRVIVPRVVGTDDDRVLSEIIDASQDLRTYHWPGNVRELEQFVRRILISGKFQPENDDASGDELTFVTAKQILARYAKRLAQNGMNASEIARIMEVDRRTAAKYLSIAQE